MTSSFDSAVARAFAAMVTEELELCQQRLVDGALPDHAAYVKWSARYKALTDALQYLSDAERSVQS